VGQKLGNQWIESTPIKTSAALAIEENKMVERIESTSED